MWKLKVFADRNESAHVVLVLGHSVAVLSCTILHRNQCTCAYLERWINPLKTGGWLLSWFRQTSLPLYFVCLVCQVSTSQRGNREQKKVTRSQRQLSYSFYFNLSSKLHADRAMLTHCLKSAGWKNITCPRLEIQRALQHFFLVVLTSLLTRVRADKYPRPLQRR